MQVGERIHHITAEVKSLAHEVASADHAVLGDAGVIVVGARDLMRTAQALQVVLMSRLDALDALRAHGAHDVASMLRLSGESPFVAQQVGRAVRAIGAFPSISRRLLDGSM